MSSVVGKLYTCDRCGATTFSKRTPISEVSVTHDRCIKDVERFAPMDSAWMHVMDFGDLCQSCYAEYKKMVDEFRHGKA